MKPERQKMTRARDLCQALNATREPEADEPALFNFTCVVLGKPVHIGSDVWLAVGAIILPGARKRVGHWFLRRR